MKFNNFFLLALLGPNLQICSDFQLIILLTVCFIDSLFKSSLSFKYIFRPIKGIPLVSMERHLI